jgi:hypothetical protein
MEWLPDEGVRSLAKYLVPDEEHLVFVMRRHWVILAEPIATAIGSTILMILLVVVLAHSSAAVFVLVVAWLAVIGRSGYHLMEWRDSWFGSTQRRLMLTYGLITHKVAMMPLEKVTDMSYARSPAGQMLGYGEFVLESAGQDQALRSVTFIAHPDQTYRLLLATMFGLKSVKPAPEPDPVSPVSPPEIEPETAQLENFPWEERIGDFLAEDEPTLRLAPPKGDS